MELNLVEGEGLFTLVTSVFGVGEREEASPAGGGEVGCYGK